MSSNRVERTLAIVKPDAVQHVDEVREEILRAGFVIAQRRRVQLRVEQCSDFYSEHVGKSFYPSLISFMSSGPLEVFLLARTDAVAVWRALMGPYDSRKAREEEPMTLRAEFGKDDRMNGFHGSDNVFSAEREIHFFFPNAMLEPLEQGDAKEYLAKYVNPVLTKGVAEVTRRKPVDPILFLAKYLEEHNPSRPKAEHAAAAAASENDAVIAAGDRTLAGQGD